MTEATPVIYLLLGDDEFALAQFLAEMENRLGDPATAAMNTTRLDGNSANPDQLLTTAGAMPFLARRRLVILTNPLARLIHPAAQKKFLSQLEKIPSSTALMLVENRLLTSDSDRQKGKLHWLEDWSQRQGERAFVKFFPLPKGAALINQLQQMARRAGGQITLDAAELLAELVDGDPRLADQEIQKLLAFVNYQRTVERDDVEALTADVNQGDIFAMVDALGARDGRRALSMLQTLLEYQDYYAIFGMVVRQFRLLIQVREVLDRGGNEQGIVREIKSIKSSYVAGKLASQARRFTQADLEQVYHRLLDVDVAVKTSQMEGELALETLVAALTGAPEMPRPGR